MRIFLTGLFPGFFGPQQQERPLIAGFLLLMASDGVEPRSVNATSEKSTYSFNASCTYL